MIGEQLGLELDAMAAAIRLAHAMRCEGASPDEIAARLLQLLADGYDQRLASRTADVLARGWCSP
ncbi:MAG TPA: hypothetical protein VG755_20620 [Nannocystaceae bacterium]|nr:hypothetical protein [Nannocystaceae bacterium]